MVKKPRKKRIPTTKNLSTVELKMLRDQQIKLRLGREISLGLAANPKTSRFLKKRQLIEAASRMGINVSPADDLISLRKKIFEKRHKEKTSLEQRVAS